MAARRPGGRRRGADAGEQSPGHAASGARSGSKDVSFCHLLASGCSHQASDAFQRGSPPSLGRSDIVARAPNRQGQASGHSSGSLTGVLRAPAPGPRRTRPGSRGGGAGGLAGPGAPRSPSPEPGREPRLGGGGQVERFGDSRGKEDRGTRVPRCSAERSQLLSEAPTPTSRRGRKGATAPGESAATRAPSSLRARSPRLQPAHGACPRPGHPAPAPGPGPGRASPVRSRPPSSAHSRTPVSQQPTMVSATRPARPVPALLAGARRCRRSLSLVAAPPPPALCPERPSPRLQPERQPPPPVIRAARRPRAVAFQPRSPLRAAAAAAAAAGEEPRGVSGRRAPSLQRTSIKRSRGRGRFITFPRPTSYPGTSFQ